ncbi:MAG: glucose-6-phosphate dehydrogenase assembly protein OpcA [Gaiellaceae bacterium]
MSAAQETEIWKADDVSLPEVEHRLAGLWARSDEDGATGLRTRVMTHLAWVPRGWADSARTTLASMNERHPSRGILLFPEPEAKKDGIDASVRVRRYTIGDAAVVAEVIELRLRGRRALAPASIVEPLLIADLPVFVRWRGQPQFDSAQWDQLVAVSDRLIVDSTEWPDLPAAYEELLPVFERTAVSDIAWARTGRWRALLASLWPGIAGVSRLRVRGTPAQAHLLAGWLRSRLGREIAVENDPAEKLEGVDLDGQPAPFPAGQAPAPADLLSDELEWFGRDPVYEVALAAALPGWRPESEAAAAV